MPLDPNYISPDVNTNYSTNIENQNTPKNKKKLGRLK